MKTTPVRLRRLMNWWPPFLFSGIRVRTVGADFRSAVVDMRLYWFNRNIVGVHFGGSLFAMTDPFWMILVKESLGSAYVVWDQAAEIRFLKPGRGTVTARFQLDDAVLDEIRAATAENQKYLRWFETNVLDEGGEIVATVRKQVYVRRKPARR